MEARLLRCDKLSPLIEALIRDYEVIAPTHDQSFGRIGSADEFILDAGKPTKPLKELFFPQREVLFEYRLGAQGAALVDSPSPAQAQRVIVGARPCDAAALPILDKLFAWDHLDAFYLQRRANTAIVSVACADPAETCFCTSVGSSPADTEGSDVLLTPLHDMFHVLVITERGKELVTQYAAFFLECDLERNRAKGALEDAWRAKIARRVDADGLRETLDFDHPIWQATTPQCLDCGVCTYLCPTCHCFDIQDEESAGLGGRVRLWDSCAFRSFTKTAVHQPRATHYSRYRQRIMHKFKYYPENFGATLCVGCGRCIRHCPVGIDITRVLDMIKR